MNINVIIIAMDINLETNFVRNFLPPSGVKSTLAKDMWPQESLVRETLKVI